MVTRGAANASVHMQAPPRVGCGVGQLFGCRWIVPIVLFSLFGAALADDALSTLIGRLHYASEHLERFVDRDSVIDSIYAQIRPVAKVTDSTLSRTQIDEKVRKYVAERYAPALIGNYAHLYMKMKAAGADFTSCNDLRPFGRGKVVSMALCLEPVKDATRVLYKTRGDGQEWKTSSVFVFDAVDDSLRLSAIELRLKEGTKAYIGGL